MPTGTDNTARRRHAVELGVALAIVAVATVYRWVDLLAQTPYHDEWHVLMAVERRDLAGLAAYLQSPATALYLGVVSRFRGIDELALWGPFAAGGVLVVAGLPLLVRRRLGATAALAFAAFLATSPLLVYYSRLSRPYGLAAPAAVALALGLGTRPVRPGWAACAASAFLTAAVAWMLPVLLPFCVGAWAAAAIAVVRQRSPALLRSFAVAAGCASVATLAVLLPLAGQAERVEGLAGEGTLSWRGVVAGLSILLGARPPWLALGWLALAVVGARAALARSRRVLPRGGREPVPPRHLRAHP